MHAVLMHAYKIIMVNTEEGELLLMIYWIIWQKYKIINLIMRYTSYFWLLYINYMFQNLSLRAH